MTAANRLKGWHTIASLVHQGWRDLADCAHHTYLPWTSDGTPAVATLVRMGVVCDQCPVRVDCGVHAYLAEEEGGFWAGVWLPWKKSHTHDRQARYRWERARARLRNRLAVTSPLDESHHL